MFKIQKALPRPTKREDKCRQWDFEDEVLSVAGKEVLLMRIDLLHGGRRPLPVRLGLALFKLRAGVYPGPPLAITYRPDLLTKDLAGYIQRGMHGSGGWSRGDAELFAAFVSQLNSCHF